MRVSTRWRCVAGLACEDNLPASCDRRPPPARHAALPPVRVGAVLAQETVAPADGSEPVEWLLLISTLPVADFEAAVE